MDQKESPPRVTVLSGSVEEFAGRSLERARKMDRGEKLPSEINTRTLDVAVMKNTATGERVWLQVRAEAFNVTNRVNSARPT